MYRNRGTSRIPEIAASRHMEKTLCMWQYNSFDQMIGLANRMARTQQQAVKA